MLYGCLALLIICWIMWYVISSFFYKQTDYYQVTHKSFGEMRFDKGNYGEYLIYKYLRFYENQGAKFLYNCYLPRDKGETTEVDIIMIHYSGVYVFESKNYSGWIFGSENARTWTQTLPNGRKVRKEHFLNPIMQNKLHIKWLKSQIGENIAIHSIIVFSERCTLKKVDVADPQIRVIKRDVIKRTIRDIECSMPDVLSDIEINDIYMKLYPYTQADEIEKLQHIQYIENNHKNKSSRRNAADYVEKEYNFEEVHNRLCPRCGAKLVLRTANKGRNAGNSFYGCSNFPKCRYTRNL